MESYHVVATHPQIILTGVHDTDTKYDVFGNYSRAIRCGALESSGLPEWEALPADGVRRAQHPFNGWVYEATDDGLVKVITPEGKWGLFTPNAEPVEGELGDVNPHLCTWVGGAQIEQSEFEKAMMERAAKSGVDKTKHPRVAFADMQREVLRATIPSVADKIADIEFSSVFFTLFPNFHPWGSFNKIVY